jgi:hypothetical protein
LSCAFVGANQCALRVCSFGETCATFHACIQRIVAARWRHGGADAKVRSIDTHTRARSRNMFFIMIVKHTPAWVWGQLAALVALGLWQTRPRAMSLARVSTLPLVLTALSLGGVLKAFGPAPVALVAWLAGALASLALARRAVAVRGASWSASGGRFNVPGSWLPLVLIVSLFALKYGAGASLALAPELATDTSFAGLCSLAYGTFSGVFLARALSLRSVASASASMQPA